MSRHDSDPERGQAGPQVSFVDTVFERPSRGPNEWRTPHLPAVRPKAQRRDRAWSCAADVAAIPSAMSHERQCTYAVPRLCGHPARRR